MPVIVELSLKSGYPVTPDTRQLHGLACALCEQDDTADHLGQDKPFSVWPLLPAPGADGQSWVLRIGWLAPGPAPAALVDATEVRLGHVTCAVTEATLRTATHAQLAASAAAGRVRVEFRSPTCFAQNGASIVLPDPRLIIGSWKRSWNHWLPEDDPLRISDETWRDLHRAAQLGEFALRTDVMDSGRGHDRSGFTGPAALRLTAQVPRAARSAFGALARYAEFCGTGAQTTHGFGATALASGAEHG